ncbi:MAG: hypothetical protein WAV38_10240 [Xanthobacteraceae bacterium]|jgi:hypothetical protein
MLGIDPDVGHLRFWVASGAAALLVLVCALALDWTRSRIIARFAVAGLGAAFGAILAWAFLAGAAVRDLSVERRNLEMRAAQLTAQVLAPGSPLACLDATGGESVEAACEKALFAGPATVAAASSYTAARLTLLSDIAAHIKAGGNLDSVLPSLRRALEADRFGFVAHALAIRDGCTSSRCGTLVLLRDPERVRANLSAQTFDRYLDRYLPLWGQPETPVADAAPSSTATLAASQPPAGQVQKKVVVDADFPSAASIPAISIMNPEPKASAANMAGDAHAAASGRRSSRKAGSSPPPAPASSAATLVPQVDAVWAPGTAPIAPPQSAVAPSRPSPPPQASAGQTPAAAQ